MIKDFFEGILTAILKFFYNKKTGDAFSDQVEIIYAIDRIIHSESYQHLNIQRAVIIKSHNDGEDIMPLSYKYMSVIYEDYRRPFRMIRDKYRGIAVDNEYVIMISEIYKKKMITIETEDMPAGMVKDIFMAEGIKYAQMFFLKHTKKGFWYISISTAVKGEHFETAVHRNELYIVVSKIRKLLKQY